MSELTDCLLKKILRYDFYINSSNIKASVIITWNGLLIGSLLIKYDDLMSMFVDVCWAYKVASVILIIMALMSIISIAFAFLVLYPFLDSGRKPYSPSLFFFGDVSKLPLEEYRKKEKEASIDEIVEDLISQSHILAEGLYKKMVRLQRGTQAIIGGVICLALLVCLKILICLK